jgi:putative membrane protein
MKKKIFFSGLIFTALCIGCNNSSDSSKSSDSTSVKSDSMTMKNDTGSSAVTEKNPSSVSKADSEFIMTAANAGMTEVTLGNIAIKNSSNDKVKAFGEMMVKDHSAAGDELKKIAMAANISVPDALSEESQKHVASLEKMHGKDFDKAYINMMVEGHEKVLKEFEDIQAKGADAELKAFAGKTVPVIKGHLDSAKSIKTSMK